MGIKNLSKAIQEFAPSSVKSLEFKNYFGRVIAIDASMCIYQFLIAIRQEGLTLQSEDGQTTSHLNGFFYRTIRMMEAGIKPVYVFDGKPPDLKSHELDKRTERRADAEASLKEAISKGDTAGIEKFERRLVRVTKEQNDDCKRLLSLMGVPYVDAPCEAEAQCAELCKKGKVFATATEDMDALTFGSNILLRHLLAPEKMGFTMEQFIDYCIILGCDYTPSIHGIGPKKAYDLLKIHKNIETIIENIDSERYKIPEDWNFKVARGLFVSPEVTDGTEFDFKWTSPDVEGIISFMSGEKNFNEQRIRSSLERLKKAKQNSSQVRIDSFFKVTSIVTTEPSAKKRKLEEEKALKGNAKKAKVTTKKKK
ncbi:Flap endonuclease 1 [Strongyloides ratti]|uniref:Flap endonuclease 1 n=1 Tax=Strongyloides ratti TaxID=34506 RepID=A0A090LE32_STRRB|nr:Flap endonuclease 1 [Strongyloides ratti]CEF66403.1 Flap endonuclease 1 [Strongyloides ratti]